MQTSVAAITRVGRCVPRVVAVDCLCVNVAFALVGLVGIDVDNVGDDLNVGLSGDELAHLLENELLSVDI